MPTDALDFEKRELPSTSQSSSVPLTLRSKFRPPPGGVQIRLDTTAWNEWGIDSHCTLGFNAHYGISLGAVTNSHCTKDFWSVDGVDVYQPQSYFFGSRVGFEQVDPEPFENGSCRPGRICRYSDSAFIRYRTRNGSGIAKPTVVNNGTLVVDRSDSKFQIGGVLEFAFEGRVVNKIGRTTGWTVGIIANDDLDVGQRGAGDALLLDQVRYVQLDGAAQALSNPGDSGSPVFAWRGFGEPVLLMGIHWGGDEDGFYSPISGVQTDFGAGLVPSELYVHRPVGGSCSASNCCKWEISPNSFRPQCTQCGTFGMCPMDDLVEEFYRELE